MTYFDIMQTFASTSGKSEAVRCVSTAALTYLQHLMKFSFRYDWSAVLSYHMAFHCHRRRDMLKGKYAQWAKINRELMNEHLLGHEKLYSSSRAFSSSSKLSRDVEPSVAVCKLFNQSKCTTGVSTMGS
ncbi:hypothetical protein M422DRAFT_258059 [Sphaerobolus stellatus SS14]|uniref:Uncharacterized protein n=1 Tax=Sphaerobolus stellatus (strain SS14) TaxID=990650 RepID=A0A0C9UWB3_SPHS4|nr:hypothetical protein M422DRAFT_258059 [Sphaerobolus stellatus SS14]